MRTCTLTLLFLMPLAATAADYTKTIPVNANPDVSVNVRSGELTVTGWDKKQILIEAEGDLEKWIEVNGNQVRIGPENGHRGIDVDVVVKLPAGSQLKASDISGEVEITGVNGRVKLGAVSGDARLSKCQGQVEIKAVSGDVVIEGVGDGLTVKGVSGDLKVTGVKGSLLEAKTVSGDMKLKDIQVGQVRMKTVSGNIELRGQFPADGRIKGSTLSGNIEIILPGDTGFDLEAKTRSGSVRTDFTLTGAEKSSGKLRGKAGSGGTEIDLNSFSGDLRVTSGK